MRVRIESFLLGNGSMISEELIQNLKITKLLTVKISNLLF